MRVLQIKNIHDTFEGQLVEVQTIAHIVVGRNGFGVVVNHNGTVAFLADGVQCLNAAPVELYGRTDTVSSRTEYHDTLMVAQIMYIIGNTAISQIQIVGLCRIFSCQRIDLFYNRNDTYFLTMVADVDDGIFHFTFVSDGTCHLEVRESLTLGFIKQFVRKL